jgi:hypothetical protein
LRACECSTASPAKAPAFHSANGIIQKEDVSSWSLLSSSGDRAHGARNGRICD